MLKLDNQFSFENLPIAKDFIDILDHGGWNLGFSELCNPLFRWPSTQNFLEYMDECCSVFDSKLIGKKEWIATGTLLNSKRSCEPGPKRFRADTDDEMAMIGASKHLIGNNAWVGISPSLRQDAGVEKIASDVGQESQLRIEESHIQKLAASSFLPRKERGENAERCIDAAYQISQGDRIANGPAVGFAGETHDSGFRLGNDVITGNASLRTEETITGNGAADQSWKPSAETFWIQGISLEGIELRLVGQEYIRSLQQTMHDVFGERMIEIQGERTLVAVGSEEVGRLLSAEWGAPCSGLVAHLFAFDLDDIRAEVSEHHGTIGAGQCLGCLDDANGAQNRLHKR